MMCRLIRDGRGCTNFHPAEGCFVYSNSGMKFRSRQGYCPIIDDGPNKKVSAIDRNKKRAGQQKQKK